MSVWYSKDWLWVEFHCKVTGSAGGGHFSCSRAGMLMFQPMACRSKPQVKRLQEVLSSHQAEQHTIRRWPWTTTDNTTTVQHWGQGRVRCRVTNSIVIWWRYTVSDFVTDYYKYKLLQIKNPLCFYVFTFLFFVWTLFVFILPSMICNKALAALGTL